MKDFIATTESGTTYRVEDGFARIDSPRHGKYTIKFLIMKVALVDESVVHLDLPWRSPGQWADATEPVVGRRLYVAGMDEWRISTPIAKVEFL